MRISQKLRARKKPIHVAIIGSGWFGSGLAKQLYKTPGIIPKVLIDRNLDKAAATYLELGLKKENIIRIHNPGKLNLAQDPKKFIVCTDLDLIKELENIDVVYEATGDVLGGAQAAINSIEKGIDFVTVNSEMDATVGLQLANLAKEKGVIYSGSDGDQPGVLARMLDEVIFKGFEPKIIGNCKEFFDQYQTPEGIKPFIPKEMNAVKACSYTDGSKQSSELAILGNAFGYYPFKRGMYGPETSKRNLINTFLSLVDLGAIEGGCIEYTRGTTEINQGGPVFIVAYNNDAVVRANMKWLKKGEGPYYLFFRDYHLGFVEAASSIAEVTLFHTPTFAPKGRYVDVITIAKRNIMPGQRLDGIGGYDCFGVVERADIADKENLLPIGLAEAATVREAIPQNTPITYSMVELSDNLVVKLRREQDQLSLP